MQEVVSGVTIWVEAYTKLHFVTTLLEVRYHIHIYDIESSCRRGEQVQQQVAMSRCTGTQGTWFTKHRETPRGLVISALSEQSLVVIWQEDTSRRGRWSFVCHLHLHTGTP